MRVTTDLWVSALVRRVFASSGFAAIVRRGGGEAGAVLFLARDRMGRVSLYGPAPQTSYDEARPDERFFGLVLGEAEAEAVDARLEREKRFDPDVWVVEIEAGTVPVEALLALRTP